MKTYLLDTIERFKWFSQQLDVKAILCSKAWYVLNEDGDTENLIFQEDNTVLVSINGSLKKYTWQYIPQNQSLNIMHTENEGTMLKPAFMDGNVLVFQKIGTKECMFLVDDSMRKDEKILTLDAIKQYLIAQEKKRLDEEKRLKLQKILEERTKQLEWEEESRIKQDKIEKLQKTITEKQKTLDSKHQKIVNFHNSTYGYWAALFATYHKHLYDRRNSLVMGGLVLILVSCIVSAGLGILSSYLQNYFFLCIISIICIVGTIGMIIWCAIIDSDRFTDHYYYLNYKKIFKGCFKNSDKPLKKFNKRIYKDIKPLLLEYISISCEIENLSSEIEKLKEELQS